MPTPRLLIPLAVALLVGVMLAGCLGGEDTSVPADDGDGDEVRVSETTGSIQGRVFTEALEPVASGRVVLVKDQTIADQKNTDAQGRYTMNDIAPGDYRLQFSAPCCNELVQTVSVEANKLVTVDVQLRAFTAADLKAPYIDRQEWFGFLPCGAGLIEVTVNPCAFDPNNDNVHQWDLPAGVQQMVVAMEWDSVGGAFGERLYITVENRGCSALECSHRYGSMSGTSPIVFTIDSPDGEWAFENIEGGREMQFRVFPDFEPDVYWQQRFAVHYHMFFNHDAPEGYTPIPDA